MKYVCRSFGSIDRIGTIVVWRARQLPNISRSPETFISAPTIISLIREVRVKYLVDRIICFDHEKTISLYLDNFSLRMRFLCIWSNDGIDRFKLKQSHSLRLALMIFCLCAFYIMNLVRWRGFNRELENQKSYKQIDLYFFTLGQ